MSARLGDVPKRILRRGIIGFVGLIFFAAVFLIITGGAAEAAGQHVVQSGESLWSISQRYGVGLDELRAANNIWSSTIFPGQTLVIPGGGAGGPARWGAGAGALTASEKDLLARLVRAEAEGEPYTGKVAVAAVVLNRMKAAEFPNTLAGVVYQPGQFEPVMNGHINRPATASDRQAVQDALNGWDPTGGALYFFAPAKTSNAWMWSKPISLVIGTHAFF